MSTKKKVQVISVVINKRPYSIKTDEAETYIKDVADEVDKLISAVPKKGLNSEVEIMTLAMLQLMDKYKKLEKDYDSLVTLAKKMELGSKNK